MEVRRLDENIKLLRDEVWGFRSEVRATLETRTTRSDLDNVIRYIDRELYHMGTRLASLEEKAKEDSKHKRQLTISLITVAVGAIFSLGIALMS